MKDDKQAFLKHAVKHSDEAFINAGIDLNKRDTITIKRSADTNTEQLD